MSVEEATREQSASKLWYKSHDGSFVLDMSHAFYYQVQTQMHICNADYCDFCVCTFPTDPHLNLHIQHIYPDDKLWEQCILSATDFSKLAFYLSFLASGIQGPFQSHISFARSRRKFNT